MNLKRAIITLTRIGALTWLGTLFLLICNANRLMFKPSASTYAFKLPYKKLLTKSGNEIVIRHIKNPLSKKTILYSHGNAEDLAEIEDKLQYLSAKGYSVISFDYPGYGQSSGKPTEKSCYEAIERVYSYLTNEEQVLAENIIFYGRSIGTGSAVELASKREAVCLVLESPFTSAFRVVTTIPLFPFDKFRSLSKIHKCNIPTIVLHGTNDNTIPFAHGRKIFESSTSLKSFFAIENCGHGGVYRQVPPHFWKTLSEFSATSGK